jgi:hypothetical protein
MTDINDKNRHRIPTSVKLRFTQAVGGFKVGDIATFPVQVAEQYRGKADVLVTEPVPQEKAK